MKLISSLRPSFSPNIAWGDLAMFFSTACAGDYDQQNRVWTKGQCTDASDTYTLPGGAKIINSFAVMAAQNQNQIVIHGVMGIAFPDGTGANAELRGPAAVTAVPGVASNATLKLAAASNNLGKAFTMEAVLLFSWDGVCGSMSGSWQLAWGQ